MYSKIKIAGHPVHPMLVAFPVACCTGTAVLAALVGLTDWALGVPRDPAAKMTGLLHHHAA